MATGPNEHCEKCGREITSGETAFVHRGKVFCGACRPSRKRWIWKGCIVVLLLAAAVAWAVGFHKKTPEWVNAPVVIEPLAGVGSVSVSVVSDSPSTDEIIKGTHLQTDLPQEKTEVELELRRAGIVVQDQADCVLNISISMVGDSNFAAFTVNARAWRWVYLDRQGKGTFRPPIWNSEWYGYGKPAKLSGTIQKSIHDLADSFLNDYLAANSGSRGAPAPYFIPDKAGPQATLPPIRGDIFDRLAAAHDKASTQVNLPPGFVLDQPPKPDQWDSLAKPTSKPDPLGLDHAPKPIPFESPN